jgi:hypothetical protein
VIAINYSRIFSASRATIDVDVLRHLVCGQVFEASTLAAFARHVKQPLREAVGRRLNLAASSASGVPPAFAGGSPAFWTA